MAMDGCVQVLHYTSFFPLTAGLQRV